MKKTIFGKTYAPQGSNNLQDGILSYYKLDSNGNDFVGSNNLTAQNPVFSDDSKNGNSAQFSGNRIETFNSVVGSGLSSNSNGLSISFWFKRTVLGVTQWMITKVLGEMVSGSNLIDWDICLYGGVVYFEVNFPGYDNRAKRVFISESVFPINEWNHCVCTYDGQGVDASLNIYANGTLPFQNRSDNYPGTIVHSPTAGTLSIGAQIFNLILPETYNFKGKIDEVYIYGRELSPIEITRLYNLETYPFN